MIELRTYTMKELTEEMHCNGRQALERKLGNYDIQYHVEGNRAPNLLYTITGIPQYFKTYCVFELGFDPATDPDKLKHFLYHYFCDDYFMSMPDEVKESLMAKYEKPISRQTIAKYEERLQNLGYVFSDIGEYLYYFAHNKQQIFTDKATYRKAWKEYWELVKKGCTSGGAINDMISTYGGIARKQAVQIPNAIYLKEINCLISIIVDSIEADSQI